METSSNTTEKVTQKCAKVLPSNWHLPEKQYVGCLQIGSKNYYTPYFDKIEDAMDELVCLKKRLGFELIKTVEEEGVYPHRAILVEEKYQESGRTNGLYTGLCTVE